MPGEPIVDPKVFERVRAAVTARRRGRAYGERYIGTGILHCGVCFRPLSAHPSSGKYRNGEPRRTYFCHKQRRGCGRIARTSSTWTRCYRTSWWSGCPTRNTHRPYRRPAPAPTSVSPRSGEIEECESIQLRWQIVSRAARSRWLRSMRPTLNWWKTSHACVLSETRCLAVTAAARSRPSTLDAVRAEWDDADLAGKRAMIVRALGAGMRLYVDPATPRENSIPSGSGPARSARTIRSTEEGAVPAQRQARPFLSLMGVVSGFECQPLVTRRRALRSKMSATAWMSSGVIGPMALFAPRQYSSGVVGCCAA